MEPGIRRLCIAVDLERYSRRSDPGQLHAQRELLWVLESACQRAGLDRQDWDTQPQGDGEVALLPPGVDETRVIPDLIHELKIALRQRNRHLNAKARLRLRVAVHQGITHRSANGYSGTAIVMVCRLLNAQALREVLEHHPADDFALIVSDNLYDDLIRHEYRDLQMASFRKVTVRHQGKGFAAPAWIHVPSFDGERADPLPPTDQHVHPASALDGSGQVDRQSRLNPDGARDRQVHRGDGENRVPAHPGALVVMVSALGDERPSRDVRIVIVQL
jgi:hypothetical protein